MTSAGTPTSRLRSKRSSLLKQNALSRDEMRIAIAMNARQLIGEALSGNENDDNSNDQSSYRSRTESRSTFTSTSRFAGVQSKNRKNYDREEHDLLISVSFGEGVDKQQKRVQQEEEEQQQQQQQHPQHPQQQRGQEDEELQYDASRSRSSSRSRVSSTSSGPTSVAHPSHQYVERRYIPFWKMVDEKTKTEWVGLNKIRNTDRGTHQIDLVPGEYKIQLQIPRELNSSMAVDAVSGLINGVQTAFVGNNEQKALETYRRKLPNMYADYLISVQNSKGASLIQTSGIIDMGSHQNVVSTFKVRDRDLPCTFLLKLFSHSIFKRLRVAAVLWRRDFRAPRDRGNYASPALTPVPPPRFQKPLPQQQQRKTANPSDAELGFRGKEILVQAFTSGSEQGSIITMSTAKAPINATSKLDTGVSIVETLRNFYVDYAPEKVDQIAVVLGHFKGREEQLLRTLENKYNVVFRSDGTAVPVGA